MSTTATATATAGAERKSSVASRFNRRLLLLYVLSILLSLPATYFLTREQVLAEANKELTMLVDMVRSVRNVVREDTRPYFLPKGEFFAPVVSSTVMAKTVAEKFSRLQPSYFIRITSDNPLNLDDMPGPLEQALLERFRRPGAPSHIVEDGTVGEGRYLVSAAPAVAREGCMRCHGSPAEAPAAITDKYGKDHGYNWKVGQVVGASVVGVPLADVNALVLQRSGAIVGVLTLIFGVVLAIVNRLVRQAIIVPVSEIALAADAVSHGNLKKTLSIDRDDEIGQLAESFERMRRSLVLVVKRLKASKKAEERAPGT